MLVIISDLHLSDGTCGKSISSLAYRLFANRLRELAISASFRAGGKYRPIKDIDILLLGDIFEALHSTRWLETEPNQPGYVRPWTDVKAPGFSAALDKITDAILANNKESIAILQRLTRPGGLTIPPANSSGELNRKGKEQPINVRIHYMIGNHDWYYHLKGPAFNKIRAKIIAALGLSNSSAPFPHTLEESEKIARLLGRYGVHAQHGDIYDSFNFPKTRDAASIADVFAVEVINRFSVEAAREFKDTLSPTFIESLTELVNVRPALAAPLWISGQLRQNKIGEKEQAAVKNLWDRLCREFLEQPLVRKADKSWRFDIIDALELAVTITDKVSFKTIDDLVLWARRRFSVDDEIKFATHALKEKAFQNRAAKFIVYGHTHHHEIVPLDSIPSVPRPTNQMYLNSGTWHKYFDLAVHKPEERKFVPYQTLTYLSFFIDDECSGRRFEAWSGAFSD